MLTLYGTTSLPPYLPTSAHGVQDAVPTDLLASTQCPQLCTCVTAASHVSITHDHAPLHTLITWLPPWRGPVCGIMHTHCCRDWCVDGWSASVCGKHREMRMCACGMSSLRPHTFDATQLASIPGTIPTTAAFACAPRPPPCAVWAAAVLLRISWRQAQRLVSANSLAPQQRVRGLAICRRRTDMSRSMLGPCVVCAP